MTDPSGPRADVTRLLQEWQEGNREALDRLIPLVYDELRALASRHLAREWRHNRLQTTVVLNEAYVKLVDQRRVLWQSRGHFFAVAARVMRRIVIDHARYEGREKRGGAVPHAEFDDALQIAAGSGVDAVDALALDRALRKLEALDPVHGRIVELRFFGGLTVEETADVLGVSATTVKRDWALAKGWLHRELTGRSATPRSE